ncbi:hypothetical protein NL676_003917 [Syzygium grande]|nr:hypothetical protein NL676_003917 [Syzygium grande]
MHWSAYPLDSNYPLIPGHVQGELVSRPSQFLYMVDSSLGAGGMSVGWKDFKNARQGDASPHSHHLCEILKAKVNQVHDSENVGSAQISNFLRNADDGRLLRTAGYKSRNYEENIVDEEPNHAAGMTIAYNRAIVDYPKYAHLSGATSQTNIIELNAHQNNMSAYVVRNGGCNAHRTLGCNDKHKGKAIVFGGVKVTANDEAMIDNQNFAQSSEATSRVMLRGAIRGEKILCGCNECNNSKHVSPYIFELHAGGRTKHPYSCIYLENGKTVYKVFQELRDTPEDVLFDAIPIIAGSAVSRLHFHLWKGHSNLRLISSAPSLD